MDVPTLRRHNLRILVGRFNSQQELAEQVNLDPAYLSKLIGPRPARPISDEIASRVERALSLPPGALSSYALALGLPGIDDWLLSMPDHLRKLFAIIMANTPAVTPEVASALEMLVVAIKCGHDRSASDSYPPPQQPGRHTQTG